MRVNLVCAVIVLGCGGGGGAIPIDQIGQRVVDAYCDQYVRCGVVASHDVCVALLERDFHAEDLVAGVHDGTIKYDGTLAGECVDAFAAQSCDPSQQDRRVAPQVCKDAIVGTVADGGTCSVGSQCISRSCTTMSCSMACCPGTCAPTTSPPSIGQPCASGVCADGAFCSNNMCSALLASGATCMSDGDCGYGLACVGATGAKTCSAVPKVGDACVQHAGATDCIADGETCDATSHCVAFLDSGATCMPTGGTPCKADLSCGSAGTCGSLPAIGSTCSSLCAPGGYCDQTTMKCTTYKPDGQACMDGSECQSTNCDMTSMKCAPVTTCA